MADNVTYLNLDKMCASAKRTAFGTTMNTFIGGLVADTAYSGDLLSTADVAFLDNMCKGSSRGGGLGTVFNELLTASKESKHITAITNTQANIFNKLCMSVTKASDTISETAYNGIGSILQWAGTKVDSMAIDVGNHILTFSLPDQVGTSVIDHTAGTITAVCANTRTNLKATFTLSLDATATIGGVTQVSGVTENTFTSPVTYTVTAEDGTPKEYVVTVSLATYDLTTTASAEATITVLSGATPVVAGEDVISYGDELTISATASTGYSISALTVNGEAFVSGTTHTVTGNVAIVAIAVPQTFDLTITAGENSTITVLSGETIVTAGTDVISYDEVLTITATAGDGYTISTLTVNGEAFTSGTTHTVTGDVAVVSVAT